jgi:translation initiation factor IF-3
LKDKKQLSLINEQIRAPKIQVISSDGENIGIISRDRAMQLAEEANLDLVLLSEQGPDEVPIARIMDFGKVLYEKKKKQADAKKHQQVQIKEIKLRPKIGEHDYQTKIKQAIDFLKSGKRVKISLFFKGRENISKEQRGQELFAKVDKTFEESGLKNVVHDRESNIGQCWFRVYYLK